MIELLNESIMPTLKLSITLFVASYWLSGATLAAKGDTLVFSGTLETGSNLVIQPKGNVPGYQHGFMLRGGAGLGIQTSSLYTFGVALYYCAAMNQVDFPQFESGTNLQSVQTFHYLEGVASVDRKLSSRSPWAVGLRLGLPLIASGNIKYKRTEEESSSKSARLNLDPYWRVNPSVAFQFGYSFRNKGRSHNIYVFTSSFLLPVYKKDNSMRWVYAGLGYRFLLIGR